MEADRGGLNEQDRAKLDQVMWTVIRYVNSHVGTVTSASVGDTMAMIAAPDVKFFMGFNFTNLGGLSVPTVQNIDLGSMKGQQHGPKIINVWETAQSNSAAFGANVVTNSKFWGGLGYRPYSGSLWLKRI